MQCCTNGVESARINGFRIARGSGNADFDESVTAQMTRIQQAEGNIPPPPDEVADQYLGRQVTLSFRGRDARRWAAPKNERHAQPRRCVSACG